jgi:AraC family transcriptional regulator
MEKFSERGYIIRENGPVYYTTNMDKTVKWFEDVLGWYSQIDERNEDGVGLYGCLYNIPTEIEKLGITPFTGIHMFYGEPKGEMVSFMRVKGINELYSYVKNNGWDKITEIDQEPWGAKVCTITTPEGYDLRFFE